MAMRNRSPRRLLYLGLASLMLVGCSSVATPSPPSASPSIAATAPSTTGQGASAAPSATVVVGTPRTQPTMPTAPGAEIYITVDVDGATKAPTFKWEPGDQGSIKQGQGTNAII